MRWKSRILLDDMDIYIYIYMNDMRKHGITFSISYSYHIHHLFHLNLVLELTTDNQKRKIHQSFLLLLHALA